MYSSDSLYLFFTSFITILSPIYCPLGSDKQKKRNSFCLFRFMPQTMWGGGGAEAVFNFTSPQTVSVCPMCPRVHVSKTWV